VTNLDIKFKIESKLLNVEPRHENLKIN
jgi:hypothetical protein